MAAQVKTPVTPEEYLQLERQAERKSEYFNGEIVALAGAGQRHNLIVTNIIAELRTQLKKRPCKVYPSDMRVNITKTGVHTYPDVMVVCGEDKFEDEFKDSLLNPTVIVEDLSESTEKYDRGRKFEHYRRMESLAEYVLVSQDQFRIEQFVRQENGQWLFLETSELESTAQLKSIRCELALKEVYDKVSD